MFGPDALVLCIFLIAGLVFPTRRGGMLNTPKEPQSLSSIHSENMLFTVVAALESKS